MITLRRARVWEGWHYLCSIPADGWRAALCCPSSQSHGWGYALDECDGGCWCYCYHYHDEKYWWQRPSKWTKKCQRPGSKGLSDCEVGSRWLDLGFHTSRVRYSSHKWGWATVNPEDIVFWIPWKRWSKVVMLKGGREESFHLEMKIIRLTKKGWTKVLFKCHLYFGQCQVTSGKEDMSGSRENM